MVGSVQVILEHWFKKATVLVAFLQHWSEAKANTIGFRMFLGPRITKAIVRCYVFESIPQALNTNTNQEDTSLFVCKETDKQIVVPQDRGTLSSQ